MKRSVLLGLFVTASMLASPSFAAGDSDSLCDTNIKTIENAKTQYQGSDSQSKIEASLQQAKAHQASKTEEGTKKCISETTQTIQEMQKTNKDGKNS
ncbi:hypothetical protein [Pseudomonas sp. SWRI154]|uniref:hypothetical protein n=1 Tax=Pseudomonas sp. SWRI154 TaxID=2745501 RepID=UPI0016472CF7|nr:hypothetical protein [Pseudomonas sp. SWRI154]MBC3364483.1 hypothetical protein [Pseudomonas sp. SWRI154]